MFLIKDIYSYLFCLYFTGKKNAKNSTDIRVINYAQFEKKPSPVVTGVGAATGLISIGGEWVIFSFTRR